MRPLVINNDIKEQINKLVAHAEKNPFSMDDLLDAYNKQAPVAGDYAEFTIHIPVGYRVVYSIEKQKKDVRHISISVDAEGVLPHVLVVEAIIKLFGFKNELIDCKVGLEDCWPNKQAISVLEVIE